jgi:hypothetical protein
MNHAIRAVSVFLGTALLVLGAGTVFAQEADEVITLRNVRASAWDVVKVSNPSIGSTGRNADLTLRVGTRYRFDVSEVNSTVHPLELRDANGDPLLSQTRTGKLAGQADVAAEITPEYVEFTLTDDMAAEVAVYRCLPHPAMKGRIRVN